MVWVESSQSRPSLSSRAVLALCVLLAILRLCVWSVEIEALVTRAECTRVYSRAGQGENDRAVDERPVAGCWSLLYFFGTFLTQRRYFINAHFLFRMLLRPRLETHSMILCRIISGSYCLSSRVAA